MLYVELAKPNKEILLTSSHWILARSTMKTCSWPSSYENLVELKVKDTPQDDGEVYSYTLSLKSHIQLPAVGWHK